MKGRPKKKEEPGAESGPEENEKKAKKKTGEKIEEDVGVIVVKPQEGKTFADIAKSLKSQVSPEQEGVVIEQISKSREGGVVLRLREATKGAAAASSEHLRTTSIGAEVRQVARETIIAIRGLDAMIEASEVAEALVAAGVVEEGIESITLGELRDGWTGRRTAIVRLPRRHAQNLLRKGKLTVGWAKCQARVTEYEQGTCCYKCQQFGHLSWQCKEKEAAEKKCYRCGSLEHIAKECSSPPKCYGCGQEGHRADSVRCPKWKEQATNAGARPAGESTAQRRMRRRAMEVKDFSDEGAKGDQEPPKSQEAKNTADRALATPGCRETPREEHEEMEVADEQGQNRETNNDEDPPNQPQ